MQKTFTPESKVQPEVRQSIILAEPVHSKLQSSEVRDTLHFDYDNNVEDNVLYLYNELQHLPIRMQTEAQQLTQTIKH